MTKYESGSKREREIIHIALKNGATLGLKGAGSKSYSNNPKLKVDCIVIKDKRIYLIQSKKGSSTKKEKEDFLKETALLEDYYYLKGLYIENLEDAKIMLSR